MLWQAFAMIRICALFPFLVFLALPCAAATADPRAVQLSADYAVCVGRLTALVDHSRLVRDPFAGALELRRDWLRAVYDATRLSLPGESASGRERHMMLRIRARRDQKALLEAGSFNDDPRRARLADTMAMRQLQTCHMMISR